MSTASIESPKPPKSAAANRARLSVHTSQESTEEAVSQLVHGCVSALRTMLPSTVLRPTQTVALVFDVAEQFLAASRRLALELAQAVEAGVEGVERYETRAA